MLDNRKKLILQLASKEIDVKSFLKKYNLKEDLRTHIVKTLRNAEIEEDAEGLEYILLLDFSLPNSLLNVSEIELLCKLLLKKWHKSHEDLVMIIDKFKNAKSIICLDKAIHLNLKYLEYNDSTSLIRKCTYALGNIDDIEAKLKLDQLYKSDNFIIKDAAREQLHRKKKIN